MEGAGAEEADPTLNSFVAQVVPVMNDGDDIRRFLLERVAPSARGEDHPHTHTRWPRTRDGR